MEDDMDAEQVGVATALERTVDLERRLRQAIHDTHAVTSDFDTAAETADAERDALLAVNDQLELLEHKLRSYSGLAAHEYDEKTVVLSQLDELRRDLITTSYHSLGSVHIAQAVVKAVRDFAEMRAEGGKHSDDGSESYLSDSDTASVSAPSSGHHTPGPRGEGNQSPVRQLSHQSLEDAIARAASPPDEQELSGPGSIRQLDREQIRDSSHPADAQGTPPKGRSHSAASRERSDSGGPSNSSGGSSTTAYDDASPSRELHSRSTAHDDAPAADKQRDSAPAVDGQVCANGGNAAGDDMMSPLQRGGKPSYGALKTTPSPPRLATVTDNILTGGSGRAAAQRLEDWRPHTGISFDEDEPSVAASPATASPAQPPPAQAPVPEPSWRPQYRWERQQQAQDHHSAPQPYEQQRALRQPDRFSRRYPDNPSTDTPGSSWANTPQPRSLAPEAPSQGRYLRTEPHDDEDDASSDGEAYRHGAPVSAAPPPRNIISQQLAAQRARYKPQASPGAKVPPDPRFGGTLEARAFTAADCGPSVHPSGGQDVNSYTPAALRVPQYQFSGRDDFAPTAPAANAAVRDAPLLEHEDSDTEAAPCDAHGRRRRRLPRVLVLAAVGAIAGAGVATLSIQHESGSRLRRWKPKHMSASAEKSFWLRPGRGPSRGGGALASPGSVPGVTLGRG